MEVMSEVDTVVMFKGMTWYWRLGSGDNSEVGMRKWWIEGTPAERAVQRTSSLSQLSWPRRSLRPEAGCGRARRRGTDCCEGCE